LGVSQWSRVSGASGRIAGLVPSQVLSEEDVSVKEMTQRQREVLGFMRGFTDKHGAPPTVREIAERFRFTPRAAFDHLRALERKGMLQRRVTDKRVSRTLVLADRGGERPRREKDIPILGKIAAGAPIFAAEQREDLIPVRPEWLAAKGGEVFALRVSGDSMIEAHIAHGDLVLVRKQASAVTGDIVAALVDDEATVKRFAVEGGTIVLKPEHPTMKPIVVDPQKAEFRILGKVVGLIREM
jgi:repressor LexA